MATSILLLGTTKAGSIQSKLEAAVCLPVNSLSKLEEQDPLLSAYPVGLLADSEY
jgi:hypothetical protein